ncbi:MAG: alpha/beta fold hydrolase, partial [Gaiellaceae bacterium]
ADIESLRTFLGVDRWLVLGGSWGSTLALAYAEAHPARASALILFGVTTGRHSEVDWLFRGGLARFFPEQWQRLEAAVADVRGDEDVAVTYNRLLGDPDPAVRARAAEAWCRWESATPDWPPSEGLAERFRDPRFAVAFARLVTHYVRHDLFLEDGVLLRGADALADTPGVLITGRFDFQAPVAYAWTLKQAWPRAELVIVDDAGHGTGGGIAAEIVRAARRFAAR